MTAADRINSSFEHFMAGRLVARRTEAARHPVDVLPLRFVFEVSGLRGELFAIICHVTDDGGRLIVDIEPGQQWTMKATGFEDDAERWGDWLVGEGIRSWLRKGI